MTATTTEETHTAATADQIATLLNVPHVSWHSGLDTISLDNDQARILLALARKGVEALGG